MNTQTNPQHTEILKLLEKFGFKFFGHDEGNNPLVVAPNGQIVAMVMAYNFVKNQMSKASSGTGPESMPQMPTNFESNFESKLEKEGSVEKAEKSKEKQDQKNAGPNQPQPQQQSSQKVVLKKDSPYGDGFALSVNPTDVDKTIEFIQKNSSASNTNPKKWLAVMFEKYLMELKAGIKE